MNTSSITTPLMERTVCPDCSHMHRQILFPKCECCASFHPTELFVHRHTGTVHATNTCRPSPKLDQVTDQRQIDDILNNPSDHRLCKACTAP